MKILKICKGIVSSFIGILLLCCSVYYTLFVYYIGIDSFSVLLFGGGLVFTLYGYASIKEGLGIETQKEECQVGIPIKKTICWKCKYQYNFNQNQNGTTYVTCPKCGVRGMIK